MPYEILRTPQVTAALRRMSARERRSAGGIRPPADDSPPPLRYEVTGGE